MKDEIRVRIDGLNLFRITDYLISCGVFLNDVIINNRYVLFTIKTKDRCHLDKICKFEHKKYHIVSSYGIKNIFMQLPKYFGVFLAFVLISCYMLSFQFVIFKINVSNDSNLNYDLNKVNNLLTSLGVEVGMNKNEYSAGEIENFLINNLNDISGASVSFDGLSLNIKVYPTTEKYEINEEGLFSKYDAVVTEINVYSGKSDIRVGQIVKQNDLLVKSSGGANASVKGKVYFTTSRLYNERQEKMIFSGNYQTSKNLFLFNKNLVKRQKRIDFTNYLTKKCVFYLCDNYLFPVKVETIYYFEYDMVEEIVKFETVEEQIKQELYDEAVSKIPNGSEICACTYSVVNEGELTRVDCYIETIVDLV